MVGQFSSEVAAAISASLSEGSIVWGSKSEAANANDDKGGGDAAIDSIPNDDWSTRSSAQTSIRRNHLHLPVQSYS